MRFTIGIIRYLKAGPAFRTTLVSVAAPGETAYTAMPEGSRPAPQRRDPPSNDELRVGIRIVGHVLSDSRSQQRFHSGGSVTPVVFGREGWQVGVLEHGYAPSGRFRPGDNNPCVGAQQVGAEQPDSQLMMADQRGLRSLDARRREHALLTRDHPCIEQSRKSIG